MIESNDRRKINNKWCSDVEVNGMLFICPGSSHRSCSQRCTSHRTPTLAQLAQLCGVMERRETSRPEAAFIVAGDFNKANLRKVLPRYRQHISLPTWLGLALTRGGNMLHHVYSPFCNGYKDPLRPPFGKSDHSSVLLCLWAETRDRPVTRTISAGPTNQTLQYGTVSVLRSGMCLKTTI